MMRYFRHVIKISAWDSPNVIARRDVLPGVIGYEELQKRLATWDEVRQCIGLRGEFYEGAQILMFPPLWLDRAHELDDKLRSTPNSVRRARAIGIDPAEGGDKTAMCAIDDLGIIDLYSVKTPDTAVITSQALAFMKQHNVPPERVAFDRGGGGKQHADRLRTMGFRVMTVAFGEQVINDPVRRMRQIDERIEERAERYVAKNRRAEMYEELRNLIDPSLNARGFAIPRGRGVPDLCPYANLRRQLAPIPLTYDGEGRLYLLPKHKKSADSEEKTLVDLIGCSPDESDALVLAIHAMTREATRPKVRFA